MYLVPGVTGVFSSTTVDAETGTDIEDGKAFVFLSPINNKIK